jgi:hypothetical protein
MRAVGGPQAVRNMIEAKNLGSIRFYEGERALQSRIAGLIWSQSYSIGDAFYKARNALPLRVRKAAFDRYIEDPYDGASPTAIVGALARLKRGELLSPSSTARLLSNRLGVMMVLTVVHCAIASVVGVHLSYWLNCSMAAAIVVAASGLFGLCWVFSPSQGLIRRAFHKFFTD